MTPVELRLILANHETWVATQGREGMRANFAEADLKSVNLEGVNLAGANLKNADLEGVSIVGVNLEGANLKGAILSGIHLRDVNLEGADLEGANLESADLEATALTQRQIDKACGNHMTKLAPGLERPEPWTQRPVEHQSPNPVLNFLRRLVAKSTEQDTS